MSAVDFGVVLVVLDRHTGAVRPLHGGDRTAWLSRHGTLAARAPIPPPSGSTLEVPVRLPDLPRVAPVDLVRAVVALLVVLSDRRFPRLLRIVRAMRRRAVRPANARLIRKTMTAVRRATRLIPAHVRPIDEAVAGLVMLGTRRFSAAFRYGVTVDPVDVHAWLEVDGEPTSRPPTAARFTPFPSR